MATELSSANICLPCDRAGSKSPYIMTGILFSRYTIESVILNATGNTIKTFSIITIPF